jgi:hypothetical protein
MLVTVRVRVEIRTYVRLRVPLHGTLVEQPRGQLVEVQITQLLPLGLHLEQLRLTQVKVQPLRILPRG